MKPQTSSRAALRFPAIARAREWHPEERRHEAQPKKVQGHDASLRIPNKGQCVILPAEPLRNPDPRQEIAYLMHFKKWNIPELDLFLPFKFESPFIEYSVNGTFFDKKKQEKEEKAEAKSALEKSHNICERCQPKI